MTPYQLGQALRDQVLLQRQRTGRVQGPRLEAVIRDLCAEEHQDFRAPLCCLVTSAAFVSAVQRDLGLAAPALLNAWNEELRQIYASGLCQRLQPVLAGLLNLQPPADAPPAPLHRSDALPQAPVPSPAWDHSPAPSPATAATAGLRGRATGRPTGANTLLITLLAFLGGVLLPLALAFALGIGIGRKPSPTPAAAVVDRGFPDPRSRPGPSPGPAAANAPQVPAPSSVNASEEPTLSPETTTATEDTAAQQRAITSVQKLYAALAAKDYDRARGYFSAGVADQFEPGSLEAYEQISIQDLRVIGQSGTTLELEGVVSLVQSDGSRHMETRSFSVDVSSDPALITASAFGHVLP
ncbi:MAG: hypothetical protein VKI42_02885 [Synechococcaceae cyanobacterium]|nr:hypothetical protein [Synechococcaceae cyanobacterium]